MLWKRKSVEPPPEIVPSMPPAAEADRALDTVASLVRTYGAHAFDTDSREARDVSGECERWAGKILLGGDGEASSGETRRDWGGLRRFFDEHRRSESAYVRASQSSMRSALGAFARCMRATVADDRAAEQTVNAQIAGLTEALGGNDPERIRDSAVSLVAVATAALKERSERQAAQLATLAEQLSSVKGELTAARERASLDPLTQLYNRAALDEHVARIADLGLMLGVPPTLLMIDVDHFKALNDAHGHPAGDEVLRRVAESIVRNFLRKEDFVARYGGEEFSVVVLDVSRGDARGLAERLRKSVRGLDIERAGRKLSVTVSVGVGSLVPGEDAAAWVERADRALYRAKDEGRDRVVVGELPAAFV